MAFAAMVLTYFFLICSGYDNECPEELLQMAVGNKERQCCLMTPECDAYLAREWIYSYSAITHIIPLKIELVDAEPLRNHRPNQWRKYYWLSASTSGNYVTRCWISYRWYHDRVLLPTKYGLEIRCLCSLHIDYLLRTCFGYQFTEISVFSNRTHNRIHNNPVCQYTITHIWYRRNGFEASRTGVPRTIVSWYTVFIFVNPGT